MECHPSASLASRRGPAAGAAVCADWVRFSTGPWARILGSARITTHFAAGEADSYLARRHAVPVDLGGHPQVQAVLVGFVLDLAVYRLHARRPPVPQDVVRRREEAVEWLRRVAEGEVYLPAGDVVEANPAGGVVGEVSSAERMFDRSGLERL